ncbi:beta-glucosidase 3B-like [Olea europaea subsp. europaea]|uniref:beta-glucosidase n=1 Tax=Olea europaea subsp. europaea TaxID=158383 RepID=A0A8S0USI5_OLEEU|nr:beta-glucosidase 3B-like [Olea europaea subsp. europaea]
MQIIGLTSSSGFISWFVISDSEGIDKITYPPHANHTHSVPEGIHAGIEMVMVPEKFIEFIDVLTLLVKEKFIPISRINDAVERILRVKFLLGLFENPMADVNLVNKLGSQAVQFKYSTMSRVNLEVRIIPKNQCLEIVMDKAASSDE